MTTATRDLYPNYVVSPYPHPRPPRKDLTLIAAASAERFSGLFAKATALVWGFRQLANDAETLALELITRAVEKTGDPNPTRRLTELSRKRLPNIGIRITRQDRGLLIEVWDSDDTTPHGVDAHLAIVDTVSNDWSCYQPSGGGKVIWAELVIPEPSHQSEQSEPLPRRTACRYSYPQPDRPVYALHDLELLRQVRDGLHDLDAGGCSGRL